MNIIVNGGSRGIGREVVLFLSQDTNNQIIATGRNKPDLESLSASSPNIHTVISDISNPDDLERSFREKIVRHFNRVDVLINMAGALVSKEFMETDAEDARLMMETNFFGPAGVIRIVKPLMPDGSHIVNISSMGGFQGSLKFPGLALYSASKAALACLTECLSEEFKDTRIVFNCLALGAVQTEMLEEAFPGYKAQQRPEEMAEFIGHFALTAHQHMRGRIIPVSLTTP